MGALYHERAYSGREGRNASQVTSILDDYYVLNYQATYLIVPVLLRFEKRQGRIKPVAELGIGFSFRLTESNNTYTAYYINQQTPTTRVLFDDARAYEQSAVLGLGLTSALAGGHHASLVVRYEIGNGVSSYTNISSATKTLSAVLSYDIFGK